MSHTYVRLIAMIAMGGLLAGCASTEEPQDSTGTEVIEVDTSDETDTTGVTDQSGYQGEELDDPSSLLSQRVVYFDFDKSDVRPEDRPVVEAHAGYLQRNPGATISLEGHADERGTREYNAALGERRANAVRNLMALMGSSAQQLRTVSWGEERPLDRGHDEAGWAENRRVEIIYLTRH